jgi:hypothetical protein
MSGMLTDQTITDFLLILQQYLIITRIQEKVRQHVQQAILMISCCLLIYPVPGVSMW